MDDKNELKPGAAEASAPTTRAPHAGGGGAEAGPGQRFSAAKKLAAVQRLMRGESLETLSRELNVPAHRLAVLWPEEPEGHRMKRKTVAEAAMPAMGAALDGMAGTFERLCLVAGMDALRQLMEADAQELCGPRHGRVSSRRAQRWGWTTGPIGFHDGKVTLARPRVCTERQGVGAAELGSCAG